MDTSSFLLILSLEALKILCSAPLIVHSLSCPPLSGESSGHVTTYHFISDSSYDRNLSSLSDSSARPLGYAHGVWLYDDATPNLCVKVTGSANRAIQLTVETISNSRICVRGRVSNSDDNVQTTPVCAQNQFQALCRSSIATNLYPDVFYEFYCDEACYESDVAFWYRFTVSQQNVSESEPWCAENSAEFPSNLLGQFPVSHVIPELQATTPAESATDAANTSHNTACNTLILTAFALLRVCLSSFCY